MTEETQTYLTLGTGSEEKDNGFYTALNYIRENANTQYGKGRLFERLIRSYLLEDPFYQKRFSEVYLWSEWADLRPEFDGVDIGIDLVAQERYSGYCAIQCKCYAENTRIAKGYLDTFISASARQPFTRSSCLRCPSRMQTQHCKPIALLVAKRLTSTMPQK